MTKQNKIKLEQLPDSFFKDLKDGNFVLVLGAGFNYGIKNLIEQNDIDSVNEELKKIGRDKFLDIEKINTIPLASSFVDLTNVIFEKNFTGIQYQLASNQWALNEFKLNNKLDLTDFFKKIFTPDRKYVQDNIKLLKSIFLPKWHNIYTLNFDTVLEEIIDIENLSENFKIYSYPDEPGFETRPTVPIIAHLHGIITSKSLDNLVFSNDSYTKIRASQQTLYDNLHAEIKSGKKILIVGTQFDDTAIDDKLMHDIDDFVFYHFDIEHNTIEGKKFARNEVTSTYVTLLDEKKKGTQLFLQFLSDNKSKIENISITGTKLIDSNFIENATNLGIKNHFTPSDFYLAKQISECQWYGIINDWDVRRDIYSKLKNEIFEAFNDKYRVPKIIARVLGRGGSGKSTLLRRLAIDLANEEFIVIWINDTEFNEFCDKGMNDFRNFPDKKFLIIIEDWYRIKQSKKESSADVINAVCAYNNVRLIIGDRTIDNSIHTENLYNPNENKFELEITQNKKLIPQILDKIKEWKSVADLLLKDNNSYNSSLYLILFTIGRKFEELKNNPSTIISAKNLVGHFQSIVESDLRAISLHYSGYAKAIYYWAKIYEKSKIYIGFDTFEKIAKYLNENKDFDDYHLIPENIKSIINIYISKSVRNTKNFGDISLVTFNQDILAEEGLAKIEIQKIDASWKPFSDAVKIKILDFIIENGDKFSVSSFLYYTLSNIKETSLSNEQKIKYIANQFDKGNYGIYLNYLFNYRTIQTEKIINKYANKIFQKFLLDNFNFNPVTIVLCVKFLGQKAASEILSFPEFFTKLPHQIVSTAMNISKNEEIGQKAASEILLFPEFFTKLPHQIVSTAMNILKNEEKKQNAASKILLYPEFFTKIPSTIVSTAMNISKNEKIRQNVATKILNNNEWKKENWGIVYQSLRCFSKESNPPALVIKIVDKIIDDFFDKHIFEKGKQFRYRNLMNIPFHQIPSWNKSNSINIKRWRNRPTELVISTLLANRENYKDIKNICIEILYDWQTEILREIHTIKKGNIHHGDHIKFSLGHPELKILALRTAIEMLEVQKKNPDIIPDYLNDIILQIVNEGKYPEWNIESEDEQDN